MTRRKWVTTGLLVLAFVTSVTAQITIPYTFVSGTVIDPDQMNANFQAVSVACNRTGCSMTGVLRVLAGTAGTPGIANATAPTTGLIIGTSGNIGMALSGTQQLLLDAAGLTIYGTNIINNTGKIPAISSTYFTSTEASASDLTSGTIPDGRFPATLPPVSGANLTNTVPSGAVMSFNLGACPTGWTEFTAARGRYTVGKPLSGTLNAAVGTALTDQEARAAGSHTHAITDVSHGHGLSDPGHLHGITDIAHNHTLNNPAHGHTTSDPGHAHTVPNYVLINGGAGSDWPPQGSAGSRVANEATVASLTNLSIVAATTAVSSNASGTGLSATVGAYTGMAVVGGGSGLSTTNAFGTSSTAAPYIQLLMCVKS